MAACQNGYTSFSKHDFTDTYPHGRFQAEACPTPSFKAHWRVGDATVGGRNADGQHRKVDIHHHHDLSLNREGRWGITDDFATSFLQFSLFSTALWDLPNSRPVHSLMLSSHLFLCLPRLLPPFTVPCTMVLARPDECLQSPVHQVWPKPSCWAQ